MRALVTGGGGFLGGAIVRRLVAAGHRVRSLSRGYYPWLAAAGVEAVRGDLADPEAVRRAVSGCDVVFHVAARAGVWGPYRDYHAANITGTDNVIAACQAAAVTRLVYTSTPSVVATGRDLEGVDEATPYAAEPETAYAATKAIAERRVLAASGDRLRTVALRPHLIWGPRDNHLVPRIVSRGRAGKLRRIGRRPCPVDSTYVDNAAEAHLLAADRLVPGSPICGRAYFISQGEPIPVWDLIDRILAAAGLPPVRGTVPVWLAVAGGGVLEAVHRVLGLAREPVMTRFVARSLATAHWFDISAARRDLGYVPAVSIDQGLERLAEWLRTCDLPEDRRNLEA